MGLIILAATLISVILIPLAASLTQLAISRKREFLADASGALLTRYPEGLISALEKIEKNSLPLKNVSEVTRGLFISDPYKNKKSS
jgi:heat shock protein HtpX